MTLHSTTLEYDYKDITCNKLLLRSAIIEYDYIQYVDTIPPFAVVDLTATARIQGNIELSWSEVTDDNTGIGYYKIFRATYPVLGIEIATTTVTKYIDSGIGLIDGVVYYYTIQPVDKDGNIQTVGNNQAWAICDKTPPSLISAVTKSTSTIHVIFSEKLDAATVSGNDFNVESFTVQSGSLITDTIVEITLTSVMPTDANPWVIIVSSIADLAGNYAVIGSSIQAKDGVPPVATSITVTPSTVTAVGTLPIFKIIFSESMDLTKPPTVYFDPEGVVPPLYANTNPVWSTTYKSSDTYTVASDVAIDPNTGDGIAKITVMNASDLVGNVMLPDTNDKFVINVKSITISNLSATPSRFNPFESETSTVSYILSETAEEVTVEILESDKSTVARTLATRISQSGGLHSFVWDGKKQTGEIKSGNYYLKVKASNPSLQESQEKISAFAIKVDTAAPIVVDLIDFPDPIVIGSTSTISFTGCAPGDNVELQFKIVITSTSILPITTIDFGDLGKFTEGLTQNVSWYTDNYNFAVYKYDTWVRYKPAPTVPWITSEPKSGTIELVKSNTISTSYLDIILRHDPTFDVSITTVSIPVTTAYAINDKGLFLQSAIYDINVTQGSFLAPAILVFLYDPVLDGNNLEIRRYDGTTWVTTGINQFVDLANNRIVAEIYQVSLYALFSKEPHVVAIVDIDPDTLNLKSKGKWVTAYIELPTEYNLKDVNINTLKITKIGNMEIEPIYAETKPKGIGDHDNDGIPDLMVKFDREALQKVVIPADEIKITVEGEIDIESKPIKFIGSDTIKIISPSIMTKVSSEGDELTSSDGVKLIIPKGALGKETEILAMSVQVSYGKKLSAEKIKIRPVGKGYEFNADTNQFAKPITIVMNYTDENVKYIDETDLKIYYWNEEKSLWEPIESSKVNPDENTLSCETNHFSLYQIMSPIPGVAISEPPSTDEQPEPKITADPTFKLGEVYAFPNPAKEGKNPTIHIEVGTADKIEIQIYNIAAELVHSVEISGNDWKIIDNKYAYEYTWDTPDVASGVFIYLVRAQKDDKVIKSLNKVAVIK
ncbi:MAG: hypothetical protein KJ967_05810 [Elusimicrobia bacterium]|nr:hypothetical protein [Elusimicrobiota bacterium]